MEAAMAFRDYSLTPASNTELSDGTYIGPNMLRNKVRPAFQQIAADGKALANELAEGLAGVATGLDNSGIMTAVLRVDLAKFGLREANSAAQNLTAIEDAIGEHGGGSHRVWLNVPPGGSYDVDDIEIETANVAINGNGSTFVGSKITAAPAGLNFSLNNLRIYTDVDTAILTLNTDNVRVTNVELEKFGTAGGYMASFEGSDYLIVDGLKIKGGNGMFLEARRFEISNVHAVAKTVGGDDFLVFKGRHVACGDGIVANVYAENFSNVVAFGSEIGSLGVNDATRAGRVENISMRNIVARECTSLVWFKPGAIDAGAAYDWRDGLISNISFQGQLYDPTGSHFARGAIVSAARGALVEKIHIDARVYARCTVTAGSVLGPDIYLPDYSAITPAGAAATIRDVTINMDVHDPYDGLSNDVTRPGFPAAYGGKVEKQASGFGTIQRVRVNLRVNGTRDSGFYVGPGITNEVVLEQFIGRNLCVDPASGSNAGVYVDATSNLHMPGENEIAMANTTYKPIGPAAANIIGKRFTFDIDAAAGTPQERHRQTPFPVWLRKATAVSGAAVGTDATNYLILDFRALGGLRYDGAAVSGNAFGAVTTNSVGGAAIVANTVFDAQALGTAGTTYEDRYLAANVDVRLAIAHAGSGQPFRGSVDLHYVQIGKAV
jgi:hypothetical protein